MVVASQLVLVVKDGVVQQVLNASTGSGRPYRDATGWHVAQTPRGRFRVTWQVDGLRVSRLGVLWRPKYFSGGYAVHGAPSVPPWPASHGCVRVSTAAMDWLWEADLLPVGAAVWVR